MPQPVNWPQLGCGAGLRSEHYPYILEHWPTDVDWFEAVTENYMDTHGRPLEVLQKIRARYPVVLHGVSLSIGSVDPLNMDYLVRLRELARRIEPAMISDHLCWSSLDKYALHDLLPLPFTEEAIRHVVERVEKVQHVLGRPLLLENVSSYIAFKHSVMPEWEFLAEVSRRSGCGILLDVNNVYVNSVNHGFDARAFVDGIPADRVGYLHMAGHTNMGKWLFDTHSRPVIEPVWDLYSYALNLMGRQNTLVEWDEDIPEFPELMKELAKAKQIWRDAGAGSSKVVARSTSAVKLSTQPVPGGPGPEAVSLADVQRWMVRRAFPQAAGDADAGASAVPEVKLERQAGDPGEERLSVYADGYPSRIAEALKETYEAVVHVLGEKVFHALAHDYAMSNPSRNENLSQAGHNFPEFLRGASVTGKLPFLPDLAELELRIMQSFHTQEFSPLVPADLADLNAGDWNSLSLVFQPHVRFWKSEWPVWDVWRARHTPTNEIRLEIAGRPQQGVICRAAGNTRCEALEADAYRILETLEAGKSLSEACLLLHEGDSSRLTPWFTHWMQLGIFADYKILV